VGLQIEVLSAHERRRVSIDEDRITVGQAAENDIALVDDAAASHLHAMLERFPAGWCITDLGSSNGTWLNGARIFNPQRVRHGDEIRVGHTRLLIRDPQATPDDPTDVQADPPVLTSRERDVLVALCRPLLARDMFTQPASTRAIAEELVVTPAAVKQHLANLYDKFGISGDEASRRVSLANEALRRGAVTIADLHASESR
jgi:pSer/pThr/pTyr-binding forkhead associated (FHA) protein